MIGFDKYGLLIEGAIMGRTGAYGARAGAID